jgi:alpha-glucosidase (family GH31 glycosyl hydrolase)
MWVDIDYMDGYRDFTYDPKKFPVHVVRRLQEHLKKNHQRFVAIVDPGIKIDRGYDAYDSGLKEDLFIKIDGKPFKGKVWPDWTYFPDWFHSSTAEWWKDQIEKWYEFVDIDGLWIDMNEVANFCDGDCDGKTGPRSGFEKFKGVGKLAKDFDPNNPKYKIDNAAKELALNSRTTPMDATHGDNSDILDYFVHNLYGHMESQVTYSALKQLKPRERPFVLTRSSFLGTGKYAAHWLGDNHSTWESMLFSLSELLKFNGIFGISMIGSDICGFVGNTNEELCTRWTQLGALIYPFARNHNALGNTPQEPYLFPNVKKAMEKYVYGIRYEFLPYWYTLLHLSSTYGETHVTRSLAWEFPHDNNVLDIFRQVLVGPGLLVTPVLEAGSKSVRGYLPEGVWFELESGKPIISSGSWYDFSAPLDFIPIHMRGSNIFAHIVKPLEGLTTTEIYEAGRIGFTVAASLGEKVAYDGSLALARGKLYMDEGAGLKLSSSLTNIDGISGLEVNMTLAMITLKKKKIRFPCKSRGECTAPVYTFSLKLDFKKTGPWESEISKAPTMDLVKILGVRHVLEQINRKQHAQLVFQNGRIADDHEIYVSEEFEPYALYHVNTPNQPSVRTNDDYTNLLLVWDKNQGVKLDGSNNEIIMEVVGNY